MLGVPQLIDDDSEFNVWMRRLVPVIALVLVGAVILMQQFQRALHEDRLAEAPESIRVNEELTEPGLDAVTIISKQAVRVKAKGYKLDSPWDAVQREIDGFAVTRTERVRAAITAGELVGSAAAVTRLERLRGELDPDSVLGADVAWLLTMYSGKQPTLPPEVAQAIINHHGWFGQLVAANHELKGMPLRAAATDGFDTMNAALVGQGWMVIVMGLVSLVCLGRVISMARHGEFASGMDESSVPPTVYMEMFAAFVLLFLVIVWLQVMTLWLTGASSAFAFSANEVLLWLTPLCFLWPRLRGLRAVIAMPDLGWTKGEGISTEIKWGVVVGLAALPVERLVSIAIDVIVAMFQDDSVAEGAKSFPAFQQPDVNGWIPLVLGAISAVVWAPIVEETIFRGALYRYARARLGVVAGILLTSALFGAIHPYGGTGLVQVGIMGIMFGLLREWRGALIAPIAAHCLHNLIISVFQLWTIASMT